MGSKNTGNSVSECCILKKFPGGEYSASPPWVPGALGARKAPCGAKYVISPSLRNMSATLQNCRGKLCLCSNVNVTLCPYAFASQPIGLSVVEASNSAFKALTPAQDLFVLERLLGCAVYLRYRGISKGFVCLAFFSHFLVADRYALWRRFSVFALICFARSSDFVPLHCLWP